MNLTHLAQSIDLYYSEAQVLQQALVAYHEMLVKPGRPLSLERASSIRPTAQVLSRLNRALLSSWRYDFRRDSRPRKFRLQYDELLHLNGIYVGRMLYSPDDSRRLELWNVCGRINEKAQNLTPYFFLT